MKDYLRLPKSSAMSVLLVLGSIALVVAVLYLARGVLIPLTLASLLSFLLAPVCHRIERMKLGRIPSVVVTVALAFTILGATAWVAAVQLIDLVPRLGEYRTNIENKLGDAREYTVQALSRIGRMTQPLEEGLQASQAEVGPDANLEADAPATQSPVAVRVVPSPTGPLKLAGGLFGSLLEGLGSAAIVGILVVFFLIRREDLRDRFIRLVGGGHVTLTTQTLEEASKRVSRYLMTQLIINISYGVPVAVGLYFIGVPMAMLWGILATMLRFIPYVGPWMAAAAPIALAFAISPGWTTPLLTIGMFVALELVSNNVIEPWLYGKHTGVSTVALLVAALFWTWLWGAVGLLLSTPITVCLLVLGKHVPQLAFLDTVLGADPVFEPKKRVYQRLLAGDQEEALDLLFKEMETRRLAEIYDGVLLPALAETEIHWRRSELDDARHDLIFRSAKELVEDLGDRHQEVLQKNSAAVLKTAGVTSIPEPIKIHRKLSILCLPARSEADEIAGIMLAQLMEGGGCSVHSTSITTLIGEMVDLVEQRRADVVCISATPPAALSHARYLYRRIRARYPMVNLIIGLWCKEGDLEPAKARIGSDERMRIVSSLDEAQKEIRLVIQRRELLADEQGTLENRPAEIVEAKRSA